MTQTRTPTTPWIRSSIAYCIAVFLISRIALAIIAVIAETIIPGPVGAKFYHAVPDNIWLDVWARWDSAFYLEIANQGYALTLREPSSAAFFPLYPILINLVKMIVGNTVLAGLIVSHLCFLAALITLHRLTELEFRDTPTANRTILYLSVFPTSLFFGAVYTESLFLLLSSLTFLFARKRLWAWAGIVGLLAASTRIVGITLLLPVLLEWWRSHAATRGARGFNWLGLNWLGLLWICAIPIGLISQMLFLERAFGDPITFWTTQESFNRIGINPINALARDLEPIFKGGPFPWNVIVDLSAFALAVTAAVVAFKQLGSSYSAYTLLGVLIPLSGGTGSLARYVVVLFPVFMMLAQWGKRSSLHWALLIVFLMGLVVLTALFVNWIFVG
jgi:Gpi18-like mannosyltransferase